MAETPSALRAAWQRHERRWADNLYVYPVVSAAQPGVSVGVNLNPARSATSTASTARWTAPFRRGPQGRSGPAGGRAGRHAAGGGGRLALRGPAVRRVPADYRPSATSPSPATASLRLSPVPGRSAVAAEVRRASASTPRRSSYHRRGLPRQARRARGPRADGRQQRRDLGQARRGHRGVLPADQPAERPLQRFSTTFWTPPACGPS